jgi:hypothetical protein
MCIYFRARAFLGVMVMVFITNFNKISVMSWRRKPGENQRPAASHWQTLSHNVVSSTPCLFISYFCPVYERATNNGIIYALVWFSCWENIWMVSVFQTLVAPSYRNFTISTPMWKQFDSFCWKLWKLVKIYPWITPFFKPSSYVFFNHCSRRVFGYLEPGRTLRTGSDKWQQRFRVSMLFLSSATVGDINNRNKLTYHLCY